MAARPGRADAAGPGRGAGLAAAAAVPGLPPGIPPAAAAAMVARRRPDGRAPAHRAARQQGAARQRGVARSVANACLYPARDVPGRQLISGRTSVTTATIDVAGGAMGGAGRFRVEVYKYLRQSGRDDIKVIGAQRHLGPAWIAAREAAAARGSRRIALNNVGFVTPGGERWTLLANALHFLTAAETATLEPRLRSTMSRQIPVVHQAARWSDVLIAPCTAMAERITAALPDVAGRVVVRMHPVSAATLPRRPGGPLILCPVIFESYKYMPERLADWLAAIDDALDDRVRMIVTASPAEVPVSLAASPRLHFVGRLPR